MYILTAWTCALAFCVGVLIFLALSAAVWRMGYQAGVEDREQNKNQHIADRLRALDEQYSKLGFLHVVENFIYNVFDT
jgi:hypothetical protein